MNVDSRDKNAVIEEGRYSAVIDRMGAGDDENLNGNAFRVRFAARDRIAVRCGASFENGSEDSSEVVTDGSCDPFGLMPYFASVEYTERIVWILLGVEGRLRVSVDPTALSKTWKASSSLRYM